MFDDLRNKKLLILGAVRMTCEIVKRAKKMGVITFVADNRIDSPAKAIADVSVFLDVSDVDLIVEYCLREGINGVTTGYVDFLMDVCFEVCMRLNLPYYASKTMIKAATNKNFFKEICTKNNIKTPTSFPLNNSNFVRNGYNCNFPLFVKPLDGSGSRGAAVCNDYDEFIENFKNALSFSKNNEVVVEEFLEGDEFVLDYLIIDKKPYLLSMFDKKVSSDRPAATNHANLQICPSKNLHLFIQTTDIKVRSMFEKMEFENGIVFLQGFVKESEIYFFEMGSRLGGTFADIDEHYIGINPIDMIIHHSLTNKMINDINYVRNINPYFNGNGAVIYLLLNKSRGVISKIYGVDSIINNKNVVNFIQYYSEGESYDIGTQTDIIIFAIYIVEKNLDSLKAFIEQIYNTIRVEDKDGNNLLSDKYDVNLI